MTTVKNNTLIILERDAYHLRREIQRLEREYGIAWDRYDCIGVDLQEARDQMEIIQEKLKGMKP